jgi:hypothetical protein
MPTEPNMPALSPGARVEVFSSFSASWVRGFEIASAFSDGYQVRRLSDRSVLPKTFVIRDLRASYSYATGRKSWPESATRESS